VTGLPFSPLSFTDQLKKMQRYSPKLEYTTSFE